MDIIRKEYTYPSVTGAADIFARSWAPSEGEIKAVLQVVHGMAEYGERYEELAGEMCRAGYALVINDHLGHGKSVAKNPDYGFFCGDKNKAGKAFVADTLKMTQIAKKEFNKPVIILGHSMGSFVTRKYITKYSDEIKGAIICGTAGPNPAVGLGIGLASLIGKVKGEKSYSKLLDKLMFGPYNNRTEKRTEFDWLSVNKDNVDWYVANDLCGFSFTVSGIKNLMELLSEVNKDSWFTAVPKNLPMFVISGGEDPVGGYGKGVTTVYNKLKDTGHTDLQLHIYEGDRHEILNENDRKKVYGDVIRWCDDLMAK